jgi:dynein heavy chain
MDEPRLAFLIKQISQAFRGISQQRLAECLTTDPLRVTVIEFLESSDVHSLFIKEIKGSIPVEVSISPMKHTKESVFYFIKLNKSRVSERDVSKELIYGDIMGDPIDHMAMVSERIYHPIVSNEETAQVWSEMVVKETKTNVEAFVSNVQITQGNVTGRTYLPLPNSEVAKDVEVEFNADDINALSHIHTLESAIIIWTKQIKNVLKQSPEMVLETQKNPGPMAEILFWRFKSKNLNYIFEQLQSIKIRRVLKVLDKSKSTYNAPFAKLCKDVFYARAEAANITKYLDALSVWCEHFIKERDFSNVEKFFLPIMHVVLLVWKSSPYYNTPSRLVVLLREICNALIVHIDDFLSGDSLFDMICQEDSSIALKMLDTGIICIGKFKKAYFDYKERSIMDCPDNPWRMQNNAIFIRVDAFMERCNDVRDMADTIAMFNKLLRTEVGGTKGKTLTTSVGNIYTDFKGAVDCIRAVSKDILDLENKTFDEAYYEFRTHMKELDRRLGSVVVQALDDATTIIGKFRALETFENLVFRNIVATELEKKFASIIAVVRADIEEARRTFQSLESNPPLPANHPPIAGALTWSRGLFERVQLPVDKLKTFEKMMERDDAREVVRLYTVFVGELSDFEKAHTEAWSASIETDSLAKLKNSILRREKHTEGGLELLYVNFDPLIVNLLRESKYFILLGLSIPTHAADIFSKAEVYRRHTGNLELIVNMYNDIQTSLLPVERPLVSLQLDKLDKTLSQGYVAPKPLSWKSTIIESFISEAGAVVRDVNDVVQTLQENLRMVRQTVESWKAQPLFERSSKTAPVEEFINQQAHHLRNKLAHISEGGHGIHLLIKDTSKRLKISQGLPDWKAYVDFVNNVICVGLIDAMSASLSAMSSQFDPEYIEKNCLAPLLEIQADLVSNKSVTFMPEVGLVVNGGSQGPRTGIKNIVDFWIEGMFGLSSAFLRLDSPEGSYLREISDASKVRDQLAVIYTLLQSTEEAANRIRMQFQKYESLWLSDLQVELTRLLEEAVETSEMPFMTNVADVDVDDHRPKSVRSFSKNTRSNSVCETWRQIKLNLKIFGDKITSLLRIQDEVSEMKSVYELAFLKINAQPVKQAISTWITKGLYTYTQYLQSFISNNLQDFHSYIKETTVGLEKTVEPGQRDALLIVMSFIRSVRRRMPEIAFCFIQLDEIVGLLKRHSIAIDLAPIGGFGALEYLEIAKSQWTGLVNRASRVKETLQPQQTNMLDSVYKDAASFEKTLDTTLKNFHLQGPYHISDNKKNDPYSIIDKYHRDLSNLSEQSNVIIEMEDLFEISKSKHLQLVTISNELNYLKQAWDMHFMLEYTLSHWKTMAWSEINSDSLLEESKSIDEQMRLFPPLAKDWEVYKVQEGKLRNTMVTLPLVKDLHGPAIKDRHWKSVSAVTGAPLSKGPSTLEDLLAARIHLHVDALSDIVEVANKELKIDSKLQMLEEIWSELKLGFDNHKESVLLVIKPPDEIFEVLDEHVLQLQNMAGMGKFVDFFRERVVEWQSTLGEVENNLKLLSTITKLWASLESIFLGSDDIRTQLPEDASRFDGADSSFRSLMAEMQENTYVVECCTHIGRDVVMQQILKELEKCEYSLNEYLEVKKSIFPRFYFVSNAALLDILRYVSSCVLVLKS